MNIKDIHQIFERNIAAGKPLLVGTPIDDAAYKADTGKVIDPGKFKLAGAKIVCDDFHVSVHGQGDILHFADITIAAGFEALGSEIFFTLEADVENVSAFGLLEHFGSPLKKTSVTWRYGPLLPGRAPDWIPTISLAAFRARLGVPGIEPVSVLVYPPAFEGETVWHIRSAFGAVTLPSLDQLVHWLGGSRVTDLFPPKLAAIGGLTLRALDLEFDPSVAMVTSVSLAIGTDKPWSPGIGKLKFEDLLLSVGYTNTDKGKGSVSAGVTGQLEVTAQNKIAFRLTHESGTGLSTMEIESETGLPLPGLNDLSELIGTKDLISHLPDALRKSKKAVLRSLQITFDSKAGRLDYAGIGIGLGDQIPLSGAGAHLEGIEIQLEVDHSAQPPIQGDLNALIVADDLMLPVDAKVAESLELTAHLQSMDPHHLFTGLPDAFPHVTLSDVRVQLNTAGLMTFSAAILLDFRSTVKAFKIPLPDSIADVHLSSFDARLNLADRSWSIRAASDLETCLIDSKAGKIRLSAPEVTVASGRSGIGFSSKFKLRGFMKPDPNVVLDFPQIDCGIDAGSGQWHVNARQASLQLFGQPPYSGFSGELSDEKISLTYAGGRKITLVNWDGVGKVNLSNLSLFVQKSGASAARGPEPLKNTEWHFGVSGHTDVSVAGMPFPEMQLYVSDQRLEAIADHPQFPPIVIEPWQSPAPRAELGFDQIVLVYESGEDSDASWRLDAENGSLKFGNIPSMVRDYFPGPVRKSSLHIGHDGAWVKAGVGADIPFPHLSFRLGKTTVVDLGRPAVRLDSVGLGFSESPFLSAELTVGLPKQPHWIADLLNDHCGFELKIAETLQLAVTSSPFSAIKDGVHRKDKSGRWWYASLQDAGDFWIRVPEFSYGGRTWDLLTTVDSVDKPALPLAPIKAILEALGVPAAWLNFLPNSLPLNGLDLRDLSTLYDQVKRLLGGKVPKEFESIIRKALAAIGEGLSLMPKDFQAYLVSSVPDSFSLRMGVDPKGGAVIGLETRGDPLRLLFPSMIGGSPELVGIELKEFSLGSAAGGLLSLVTADCHIDRFDLLTIGTVLAIRDKNWSRSLRNRIYLEKVFAVVPNEFPIPIMVTYDHIGWDLKSWLGIGMHTHFYFPAEPHVLWNWITDAIVFFKDAGYHLHTEPHPRLAGNFTIGENYLTLPKYLGADPDKAYGLNRKLPALDVDKSLSFILDGLKFANPGFIIRSVPLYKGPDSNPELLPFRINRSHIDFGPLSFDVAWCITTQEEFKKVRHLPAVADALRAANNPDVLHSLPETAHGPDYDKGFVMLFSEETAIFPIAGVKAQFGVALTGGGGFETGIQLTGTIAELLAVTLRGDIRVPAPPGSGVSIHGDFNLKWSETHLLAASAIDIVVTGHSFELRDISLKLHGEDCVLAGKLIIDAHKGVIMGGHFRWAYGSSQPAIDRRAEATFSDKGIDVRVTDAGQLQIFGHCVKKLTAYLYPGKKREGATIGFDTGPLNKVFTGEFGKLSSALKQEVQSLWQQYQSLFEDFSSIFTDVETIRKNLPPALKTIIENAPGEIHKHVNSAIDQNWPSPLIPGKKGVKRKARDLADKKAKGPLANLSTLRTRIPKATTDQLKQGLLSYVDKALKMKSISIGLNDISKYLPDKKIPIHILQRSQIDMLEKARKYIPQIPGKRQDSDAAWRKHYLGTRLEEFVDGIAQSIDQGLQPPRLVELNAGAELAKDSPSKVTAHVKVVYKDPQRPFEKNITVDLKKLLTALPKIAREFAVGTEPTPPDPPPPPQPA